MSPDSLNLDLEKFQNLFVKSGWDIYVNSDSNPYTDFATKHNVDLSSQKILLKCKTRSKYHGPIHRVRPTIKFSNYVGYSKYLDSPWSKWFRLRTKKPIEYTIADYKKDFRRRLPFWAQSFSEQGISETSVQYDKYKHKSRVDKAFQNQNCFDIERELLANISGKLGKFMVERIYNDKKRLIRVVVINIFLKEIRRIKVEDSLGRGRWKSSDINILDAGEFVKIRKGKLLGLEKPWSLFF